MTAGFQRLEDLDVAAAEAGAPGQFFCPISYTIMRDPVLLSTGQTYDSSVNCLLSVLAESAASSVLQVRISVTKAIYVAAALSAGQLKSG